MPIRRRISDLTSSERELISHEGIIDKIGIPKGKERVVLAHLAYNNFQLPVPKEMDVTDLLTLVRSKQWGDNVEGFYRDRIRSPLTGIRAFCVFCKGGSPKEATECGEVTCPLWSFRTGKNPFHGKFSNVESID